MGVQGATKNNNKMHAFILTIVGIILLIAGVAIATVHGPLRGTWLGTISLVIGIVLLVISFLRFSVKRSK
jgi:uncharacterized membrane protein